MNERDIRLQSPRQAVTARYRNAVVGEKLRRNRRTHPLFDIIRYTRNLEAIYARMWQQYQTNERAVSFAVDDVKAA